MPANEPIVGIDLGTTFSLIAYVDAQGPRVIRDENGDARLPSVVSVPASAGAPAITVGWEARNRAVEYPRDTVYSVKRLIGRSLADLGDEAAQLPYRVARGPRDTVVVEIGGRQYSPEEISALVLRALVERAEKHLGRPVKKAVITVPAYFDDAQRQATRVAGQAAGLEVLRIINEPTAAALSYGIGLRAKPAHGPTDPVTRKENGRISLPQPKCHEDASPAALSKTESDGSEVIQNPNSKIQNAETVAVYDLGGGTFDISILRIENGIYQVLSTAGDTHLGGDDFDRALMDLVTREVREQFQLSIDSPRTKQGLRLLAEAVKIKLSEQERADLELDLGQGRTYRRVLPRGEFEALIQPFVERTLKLFERVLRDAKLNSTDLDEIVFVGGSTRIPLVRRKIEEWSGRKPYTALNPDEVVALGAAIQASILSGTAPDMLLLDVIPLSLGIETMGGAMGKLIVRNTTIPCRATEMFTTFVDGQTAIKFNVLQGERELAQDCRSLAEFVLRGVPPMPAGLPKVEVEFLVDANGILNVAAKELRSGRQASIQAVPNFGLTREEIDRITRESVAFAQADIDAHRRIDLRNQVDFDTSKTEQMLAKAGHLLDAAEYKRIENDIAALRKLARETNDLNELHRALQAFGQSTVRLAELGIRAALVGKQE